MNVREDLTEACPLFFNDIEFKEGAASAVIRSSYLSLVSFSISRI